VCSSDLDVCTLFYSEFESVISQIPTALQLIPAQVDASEGVVPYLPLNELQGRASRSGGGGR